MGLIVFELIILLIVLSNLRRLRRLDSYPLPSRWPHVSILVPARNEEANIGPCVRSLLAQAYPDFQVAVLDDQSGDRTWQILTGLAAEDERLYLIKGHDLPPGWLGKHWACHQLAQAAGSELLLFTDADTRHHPFALRDAVAALLAEEVDLLTALPRQEVGSWAERLVVPLIPWSIIAFVPLSLAYRLRWPMLSATVGQFMLFRRRAYEAIGGYVAVRDEVVDDLALGRRIKVQGRRWRLLDGGGRIDCRMYRTFEQVYEGLSKNLFAVFEYKIVPFLFVWLWLGHVFWTPLLVVAMSVGGVEVGPLPLSLAVVAIALALLLWGLIHQRFGFPRYLTVLYPLTILLAIIIALRSMILTWTGRATWKQRNLTRPQAKETGQIFR